MYATLCFSCLFLLFPVSSASLFVPKQVPILSSCSWVPQVIVRVIYCIFSCGRWAICCYRDAPLRLFVSCHTSLALQRVSCKPRSHSKARFKHSLTREAVRVCQIGVSHPRLQNTAKPSRETFPIALCMLLHKRLDHSCCGLCCSYIGRACNILILMVCISWLSANICALFGKGDNAWKDQSVAANVESATHDLGT